MSRFTLEKPGETSKEDSSLVMNTSLTGNFAQSSALANLSNQPYETSKPLQTNSKSGSPEHPGSEEFKHEQKADESSEEEDEQHALFASKVTTLQAEIVKHRQKLQQLEKVINAKKDEEALLQATSQAGGSIVFGQTRSISALVSDRQPLIQAAKTNDKHSVEELERMREQLKDILMLKQNQLKILVNSRSHLTKLEHADKVCEAYFESEKTWFAALIQDVDETAQEAEIAWIGYNIQERLPAEKITILPAIDPEDLFEGANCNAVAPSNGMWYQAVIEKVLTPEEAEQFASADLRTSVRRFQVRYTISNTKMTVPLDYLRITGEQAATNARKKQNLTQNRPIKTQPAAKMLSVNENGEFIIPDALKINQSDTEKVRLQKKKKQKAMKQAYKTQQYEQASRSKQNEWQNFQKKGARKSQGYFAFGKAQQMSIFKTPESAMGKVGVVNSGQAMTSYAQGKVTYSQHFGDADDQQFVKRPKLS